MSATIKCRHEDCEIEFVGDTLGKAYRALTAHIGLTHPDVLESHDNGDDETPCRADGICPDCNDSALDAGIPLSVVLGRSKLTDHFSEEHIAAECGRAPEPDPDHVAFERMLDRADMERKRAKGE